MSRKSRKKLSGKVQRIIKPPIPALTEKADIVVEEAEPLYRELRIENKLKDEDGKTVRLKPGAEVDITLEADKSGTAEVRESPPETPQLTPNR